MSRYQNIKNQFGDVNRSIWLALGIVVIAALIAATYIQGDMNERVSDNNDNNGTVTQEERENGEDREGAATAENDENNDGEVRDEDNDETATGSAQQMPAELADTGPASAALALGAMSATGYLYRRSKNELNRTQQ